MSERPEDLIERAIESVLEQVPDVADEEPEGSAKLQPWAETAAPAAKNKRPLSELLDQYAARVAADPDAVAGRPRGQHPVAAFFARFTPQGGGGRRGGGEGAADAGNRGRRRRGRRGAPGAGPAPQPQGAAPQPGRQRGSRPQQGDQRPPRNAPQQQPAAQDAGQRRSSTRRRRRRGRGPGGGGAPTPG